MARDFALYLNTKPSEVEKVAWLKASPRYKRHGMKMCFWLPVLLASISGLGGIFYVDGYESFEAFWGFIGLLALTGFSGFFSLMHASERSDLLGWGKLLKEDTYLCERFVEWVKGTQGRVLAKDRELCGVDLVVARLVANQQEHQQRQAVCAEAHSFVEVSA